MAITDGRVNNGGYQAPSNPAVVSGPGALSQRTDGSPTQAATYIPGLPYGEGQKTYNNQVAADMQGSPFSSMAGANIIGLDAPTTMQDTPGTEGIDLGPGGGSNLMMDMPTYKASPRDALAKAAMFDDTGTVEIILNTYF
jgi:hypothetical protein